MSCSTTDREGSTPHCSRLFRVGDVEYRFLAGCVHTTSTRTLTPTSTRWLRLSEDRDWKAQHDKRQRGGFDNTGVTLVMYYSVENVCFKSLRHSTQAIVTS